MSEAKFAQNIESLPVNPERAPERLTEQSMVEMPKPVMEVQSPSLQPMPSAQSLPVTRTEYKDARLVEIERVLEQDLEQLYFDLPEESKRIFKTEGELTARKIGALMSETKATAEKVLNLILAWLSLLPGVNRFFVEQEAKIKTDKILMMENYGG
jgi:hypothetical protein